jgi:hydrogenase maturation protein HypF
MKNQTNFVNFAMAVNKQRLKITIRGAVQGVGFRPFIYRIANDMKLAGWVLNSSMGVFIEVEGEKAELDSFVLRIEKEKPNIAIINSLEFSFLDHVGFEVFEIRKSEETEEVSAFILPDIAVCDDCLQEMNNPNDRRYLYPFINCTNCGPRFSIIESLPYDRPNTSMKSFKMCDECRVEYENPADRRFHAQPTACLKCGPWIELWNAKGEKISEKEEALSKVMDKINNGNIVALKGLGGYQLLVDTRNIDFVQRLRDRKNREEKPFAVMYPDLESVKHDCEVSNFEERLLLSPESPIVLLKKKESKLSIAENISPGNPFIGVMLPYTPLHHLLMKMLNFPVVATSANISEEPMVINESLALEKLKNIADYYLVHNRSIVRHVDDSIVRVIAGQELVMRRARGYAPLPVTVESLDKTYIAAGAHLKNTISISSQKNVFISQHIGDLETEESLNTYKSVITDFEELYHKDKLIAVSDLHPEYLSSKYFKDRYDDVIQVQHHAAHIAACRAENQVTGEALGVSWDGTGLGEDGSIWGGEFFFSDDSGFKHIAQFRKFSLPGGDKAIREPRRSALGLLFEIYGEELFNSDNVILNLFEQSEINVLKQMLIKGVNSPRTSSVGRLFDAVSALVGLRSTINYEGQAAMMLEHIANQKEEGFYDFGIIEENSILIDWFPMVKEILKDISDKINQDIIAAKFHNTLVEIILDVGQKFGINKIVLSGGCFQNAVLLEKSIKGLTKNGFKVYRHQRIPPNDGGISLGQVVIANQIQIANKYK